jgi:hypothetical protein
MSSYVDVTVVPQNEMRPLEGKTEGSASAVAWGAVAAGAFVTAATALILLALGAGAGLSSLSPWSNSGVSPSAVGKGALVWMTIAEILSASIGGYVAGRLRTKWVNLHTDEVYFRDTAHGFLVWAVALVMTAAFLTSAAASLVGSENRVRPAASREEAGEDANRYFIDGLFRPAQPENADNIAVRNEIGLIFAHSLRQGELLPEDSAYIAQIIALRTGISKQDAETRVTDAFQRDQQALDASRKAVAHSLYWLFVAMLFGAFCASFAATIGGRQRDRLHVLAETR